MNLSNNQNNLLFDMYRSAYIVLRAHVMSIASDPSENSIYKSTPSGQANVAFQTRKTSTKQAGIAV